MDFYERLAMRPVLWARLHELTGNAFQEFFHDLMSLTVPGFIDVRTHGKLGDMGSDGLALFERKLYACYAPEVPDAAATIRKLNSDLEKALEKRASEFATFVFVHNDARGIHPEVSSELAALGSAHNHLSFEVMGLRHIRDILGKRTIEEVEGLLGVPMPLSHNVAVGLPEMEELLLHIETTRIRSGAPTSIAAVSAQKLAYSQLSEETQSELRDGMKYSTMISNYYSDRIDVLERDEVAARFKNEYQDASNAIDDPEDQLTRIRQYLGGTKVQSAPTYRAQTAVLAYFFQTCDIFRDAPQGWSPPVGEVV